MGLSNEEGEAEMELRRRLRDAMLDLPTKVKFSNRTPASREPAGCETRKQLLDKQTPCTHHTHASIHTQQPHTRNIQ